MIKTLRILMIVTLMITLSPLTKADSPVLTLEGANLKMTQNTLRGIVKVCNREAETMNFSIDAKNLNTNQLYSRKVSLPASDCDNFTLAFTPDFIQTSNTGDTVRLNIRKAVSKKTDQEYKINLVLNTKITEDEKTDDKCKDVTGKDGIYTNLCVGDFIYHQPTGLRIKVLAKDSERIDLLVNHVRWGGVKTLRITKGKSAELVSVDGKTRVMLSNLEGATGNNVSLKITSY